MSHGIHNSTTNNHYYLNHRVTQRIKHGDHKEILTGPARILDPA